MSMVVSISGLLGVVLFAVKNNYYNLFFKIWIFAQFILVYITDSKTTFELDHPIFVTIQIIYKYTFGLTFNLDYTFLHVEFNLIPFVFLFIYYTTLEEN